MTAELALPHRPAANTRAGGLPDKMAYAAELASSGLLPAQYRRQPANVLYALEYAEMLGLSPMAAITGIHVIEGKPSASAGLMSALVRQAGHRLRLSGDDKRAVCEIVRRDDPEFVFRSEWTIERAKQAGITGKPVWKNYPAAMLKARAISECARDACEEALMGMHYTAEEMGVVVDEDGAPDTAKPTAATPVTVADVRRAPQPEPRPEFDWDAAIRQHEHAGDRAALTALWKRAKAEKASTDVLDRISEAGLRVTAAVEAEPVDAEVVEDAKPAEPVDDEQMVADFWAEKDTEGES